ncbi:Putative Riboflavin aldehyde-forming enzyme [Penicillium brasilianum]|uniref:Putative Riboflavin aldehyde-forming enzyme n=1 Tax=Penicillium brasilianum TaxID=104259 RepID=A0A0F7VA39_PENBI|nr:Putative Riboflavin aldehyde-forming enzyme [Penicillium brasilianum]
MLSENHAPVAQAAQDTWGSMPKRKPVPATTAAIESGEAASGQTSLTNDKPAASSTKKTWLPAAWLPAGGLGLWFASQKRSRKLLIIGIGAGIVLIALIIGLAVGLTVGNKHSNLPLPTANGGPYEGDLTYYNPALGSCGYTNTDSDMICAVSHILYDAASTGSNPNANPLCGLKIRLRRNGESVDVKIVDRCVGCAVTDLDVTEAVFKKVADLDQGRVSVEWSWLETPPVSIS